MFRAKVKKIVVQAYKVSEILIIKCCMVFSSNLILGLTSGK